MDNKVLIELDSNQRKLLMLLIMSEQLSRRHTDIKNKNDRNKSRIDELEVIYKLIDQ